MQRRARLGLIAAGAVLGLGLRGAAASPEPASFLQAFPWSTDDPLFGGLSAVELSADGVQITVLTDRGAFATGTILRDTSGRITGVDTAPLARLHGPNGALNQTEDDCEGLALGPDGRFHVSFEGRARVQGQDRLDAPATVLDRPRDFLALPRNAAFEALAVDGAGAVYTLPEDTPTGRGPFSVYRHDGQGWDQPFSLTRTPDFHPVGADFGPDGRLYVLERAFFGMSGFASRVRAVTPGAGVLQGDVILLTPPGTHGNLEGLSVWQDTEGAIRLTMVSDDNFVFLLRTEIVEYRLPPEPHG